MNFTISTPFLSQKTVAISFLADICLNFLGLFGECVCIHCFGYTFVSTFHKLNADFITCYSYDETEKFIAIYRSKKVKAEVILCVLCTPVSIFGTHLAQNL
jgi:hypothetical protein